MPALMTYSGLGQVPVTEQDVVSRMHELRDWVQEYIGRGDAENAGHWAARTARWGLTLLRLRGELE